jgi:cell division protein DivIC
MKQTQKEKRQVQRKVLRHRLSVILISAVIVILTGVLSVGSVNLLKKKAQQDTQIAELEKQKLKEEERKKELEEKEKYYNSDKYIEDVARDKGLAYENEILFKPEQ